MADFVSIAKRAVGKFIPKSFLDAIIDNLGNLNSRLLPIEGRLLPGGSFESDSDGDGTPDGLTVTTNGAATYGISTTEANVRHGKQSFYGTCTSGASDDVTALFSTYIPCGVGERIAVDWLMKASVAGIQVDVDILWWYWTGSAWAAASTPSSSLYTSTSNPTSWTKKGAHPVLVPTGTHNAEAYQIRITTGGNSTAGTVYFDGVDAHVYHGWVMISRQSLTAGTVDISSYIGNERALKGMFTVELFAGDPGPTTITSSGNSKTSMSLQCVTDDYTHACWVLELDSSYQCTITYTSGGTGASYALYLIGYEV